MVFVVSYGAPLAIETRNIRNLRPKTKLQLTLVRRIFGHLKPGEAGTNERKSSMAKTPRGGRGTDAVPAAHQPDVATLDAIVKALYESVSFPPGRQPDYIRLKALLHPEGRIIPPRTETGAGIDILDPDSFIARSREFVVTTGMERQGFHEKEVARRTSLFGTMVHVLSTYESRHTVDDPVPFQRGINSIQIVKDQQRFWVVSILWETERPGHPIPRAFLL